MSCSIPLWDQLLHSFYKRHCCSRNFQRRLLSSSGSLFPPSVLYSDNHLLVVNKPAGWHSIPHDKQDTTTEYYERNHSKCLLSFAKRNRWGGGSNNDFLLPLHRIDQPCSGILIFGKTSKAASRVTTIWKKDGVVKDYLCVISSYGLPRLLQASTLLSDKQRRPQHEHVGESGIWYHLEGTMQQKSPQRTRSVVIYPHFSTASSRPPLSIGRRVHVSWKRLDSRRNPRYCLIQVQTTLGARHMVRALLAQVGNCPIAGDVRYYPSTHPPESFILPDKSVALHAYRVSLDPSLRLGRLNKYIFEAPIPASWADFFGIHDS